MPQINQPPLPATAISIVFSLIIAWCTDGILKGKRWPPIFLVTVINIIIAAVLRKLPLYGHDKAHFALYYLSQTTVGAGTEIMNWITELTGADRALTVSLANDLAFVVQAVAPNFIWKPPNSPRNVLEHLALYSIHLLTAFVLGLLKRESKNQSTPKDVEYSESREDSKADSDTVPYGHK